MRHYLTNMSQDKADLFVPPNPPVHGCVWANGGCFTLKLRIYSSPLRPTPPPLTSGGIHNTVLPRCKRPKHCCHIAHRTFSVGMNSAVDNKLQDDTTVGENSRQQDDTVPVSFSVETNSRPNILRILQKNIMTDNVPKPRYRKQCYLLKSFKIMS